MKKRYLFLLFLFVIALIGCGPKDPPHVHDYDETVVLEATCLRPGEMKYTCKCGDSYTEPIEALGHDLYTETVPATCTEDGHECTKCTRCNYQANNRRLAATGHKYEYIVQTESKNGSVGVKYRECSGCHVKNYYQYKDIGYSRYGRLEVNGTNLVSADTGETVQLIGLSTHGLHWYGQYVNKESLEACKEAFNVNLFRFSLYTAEGGYCMASELRKEQLYNLLCEGIRIATELDMYVIVDWHMLGEVQEEDANPLYYKDESMSFFDRITKEFKDYDNIFYEIMNEPCRRTTWADCKAYANEVIPVIRANDPDAIVLVGNPKWSSDLVSPAQSPLIFDNIMYTYHFYAADLKDPKKVTTALSKGLPVFITEHGGMAADGDGPIDETSINNWYKMLDANNISYVAWNISNNHGSSSILRQSVTLMNDFSDEYLKEWGIFYKKHIKARLGLR